MKELGVDDFIKKLIDKVKDALGITDLENAIKEMFEKAIGKAYAPIAGLSKGDGENESLAFSVKEVNVSSQLNIEALTVIQFKTTIADFQRNPMQALWNLVMKGCCFRYSVRRPH